MSGIYSFCISIYYLIIRLASGVNPKAKSFINGRTQSLQALKKAAPLWANKKVIWIHAASYGEYEMAKPIIKSLSQHADIQIIISFYSSSGYDNTHFAEASIYKIYLPIDLLHKQVEIINLINPDKVVFIKYEFWYNLLRALHLKNIPYYFTSLHLNRDSYIFNILSRPLLNLIKKSKHIYCHNKASQVILKENNIHNTTVMGDSRISQVLENASIDKGQVLFKHPKKTIILGSIIPDEYPMIKALLDAHPEYNYIIAPHDVDSDSIAQLQKLCPTSTTLYTSILCNPQPIITTTPTLIIDTIGDLRYLYRCADVAYVGAGFDKGPHNVLEPLVYGLPTITGSNIRKFPMAQFLAEKKLLLIQKSKNALPAMIEKALAKDQPAFKNKAIDCIKEQEIDLDTLVAELISH